MSPQNKIKTEIRTEILINIIRDENKEVFSKENKTGKNYKTGRQS